MFKKGNRIRNKSCLDVDLVVGDVVNESPDHVELKVWYWNRHYSHLVNKNVEVVKIKREHFDNWTLMYENVL